ncbi:TRNA_2-methylthioadenosine synthase [Hexamita inflata]|uniref:Threonylcarbamoyladenosine tRNA methylthiotransferase n=1 Tax=Hexamita inflata TaxID=28002 RepID=A0AA86PRI4_9EUKA|nr:TRNA 2-methylthioadenosine synthase [Hexamita inflata]
MDDIEDPINQVVKLEHPVSIELENLKFNMITMGCAHNQADSDQIVSKFLKSGATLVPYDQADLIYINSCTVKTPSQEKAIYQSTHAAENGKLVVLGGCVPQSMRLEARVAKLLAEQKLFIVGVLDDAQLQVLLSLIKNRTFQSAPLVTPAFKTRHDPSEFPVFHSTKIADVIPLSQGCLGSCTYCKTVQSRGRLVSYPIEQLKSRFEQALSNATIQELWLTGEDTLAWGLDQNSGFSELFDAVMPLVEQTSKMVRVGMTDPESVINQQEQLIKLLKHKNIYKFLHLPVQSGSTNVLKQMKRRYTYEEFEGLIKNLMKQIPELVIATDVIVGFPGETEEDHQLTIKCLKDLKFQIVNVTQFYPRENTIAAKMEQIDPQIKKRRSLEAATEAVANFNRQQYIGQKMDVIVSEVLELKPEMAEQRIFGAKSYNYLSVLIQVKEKGTHEEILKQCEARNLKIGARVQVKIIAATRVCLVGVEVEQNE